jgi:hypothetical protein
VRSSSSSMSPLPLFQRWADGVASAANVTMPQRPVIDDISVEDDDEEDVMGPFIQGDIFETHSVRQGGRTRRWDAFRAKLRDYGMSCIRRVLQTMLIRSLVEELLAARSLWTSRSATREVFDTSFSLSLDAAQTGASWILLPRSRADLEADHTDTRTTWLADFRVNVPSTNASSPRHTRAWLMDTSVPVWDA